MKDSVTSWRVVVGLIAVLSAPPVLAHHSTAMFDKEKTLTWQGTVKQFLWVNPHSWLQVMVTGADGKAVEWDFESSGPSTLMRVGIKAKTFLPGDKVTVVAHPVNDGRNAGLSLILTGADGRVYSLIGKP